MSLSQCDACRRLWIPGALVCACCGFVNASLLAPDRRRDLYAKNIEPPKGWRLVRFGHEVPHAHREYIQGVGWDRPRRCRNTMTPLWARVSGDVLAFATPIVP